MPNPTLLVCDSDALIQLLLIDELRPLRELKKTYGIQPTIVPEVEIEIKSIKKFDKFKPNLESRLDKAISAGTVEVFGPPVLQAFLGNQSAKSVAVTATWGSIQALGGQYNVKIGTGEAYTHATAVSLSQPALSNDWQAVRVLREAGLEMPSPILRAFDLVVFLYQVGIMSEADCDSVRKTLLLFPSEALPKAFKSASFKEGLKVFSPRLADGEKPIVGAPASTEHQFAKQLVITRKA